MLLTKLEQPVLQQLRAGTGYPASDDESAVILGVLRRGALRMDRAQFDELWGAYRSVFEQSQHSDVAWRNMSHVQQERALMERMREYDVARQEERERSRTGACAERAHVPRRPKRSTCAVPKPPGGVPPGEPGEPGGARRGDDDSGGGGSGSGSGNSEALPGPPGGDAALWTVGALAVPFLHGMRFTYWNPFAAHAHVRSVPAARVRPYALLCLRVNYALHLVRLLHDVLTPQRRRASLQHDHQRHRHQQQQHGGGGDNDDDNDEPDEATRRHWDETMHHTHAEYAYRVGDAVDATLYMVLTRLRQLLAAHMPLMTELEMIAARCTGAADVPALVRLLADAEWHASRVCAMPYTYFAEDEPRVRLEHVRVVEPPGTSRIAAAIEALGVPAANVICGGGGGDPHGDGMRAVALLCAADFDAACRAVESWLGSVGRAGDSAAIYARLAPLVRYYLPLPAARAGDDDDADATTRRERAAYARVLGESVARGLLSPERGARVLDAGAAHALEDVGGARLPDARRCTILYTCLLRVNAAYALIEYAHDAMRRAAGEARKRVAAVCGIGDAAATRRLDADAAARTYDAVERAIAPWRALAYDLHCHVMDHVPLAAYMCDTQRIDDASLRTRTADYATVYPEPGRFARAETLPDVLRVFPRLSFTELVRKRSVDILYMFSKIMPNLCQVREIGKKMVELYDGGGPETRAFLDRALECSLLAMYPHANHGELVRGGAGFARAISWYRLLYVRPSPGGAIAEPIAARRRALFHRAVGNKHVINGALREFLIYSLEEHDTVLRDFLRDELWTGAPFVDYRDFVRSTVHIMNLVRRYAAMHDRLPGRELPSAASAAARAGRVEHDTHWQAFLEGSGGGADVFEPHTQPGTVALASGVWVDSGRYRIYEHSFTELVRRLMGEVLMTRLGSTRVAALRGAPSRRRRRHRRRRAGQQPCADGTLGTTPSLSEEHERLAEAAADDAAAAAAALDTPAVGVARAIERCPHLGRLTRRPDPDTADAICAWLAEHAGLTLAGAAVLRRVVVMYAGRESRARIRTALGTLAPDDFALLIHYIREDQRASRLFYVPDAVSTPAQRLRVVRAVHKKFRVYLNVTSLAPGAAGTYPVDRAPHYFWVQFAPCCGRVATFALGGVGYGGAKIAAHADDGGITEGAYARMSAQSRWIWRADRGDCRRGGGSEDGAYTTHLLRTDAPLRCCAAVPERASAAATTTSITASSVGRQNGAALHAIVSDIYGGADPDVLREVAAATGLGQLEASGGGGGGDGDTASEGGTVAGGSPGSDAGGGGGGGVRARPGAGTVSVRRAARLHDRARAPRACQDPRQNRIASLDAFGRLLLHCSPDGDAVAYALCPDCGSLAQYDWDLRVGADAAFRCARCTLLHPAGSGAIRIYCQYSGDVAFLSAARADATLRQVEADRSAARRQQQSTRVRCVTPPKNGPRRAAAAASGRRGGGGGGGEDNGSESDDEAGEAGGRQRHSGGDVQWALEARHDDGGGSGSGPRGVRGEGAFDSERGLVANLRAMRRDIENVHLVHLHVIDDRDGARFRLRRISVARALCDEHDYIFRALRSWRERRPDAPLPLLSMRRIVEGYHRRDAVHTHARKSRHASSAAVLMGLRH